jgi:hypothetical protein
MRNLELRVLNILYQGLARNIDLPNSEPNESDFAGGSDESIADDARPDELKHCGQLSRDIGRRFLSGRRSTLALV